MTGYIKDIRKMVGHSPIIQCGGSVIVENSKGEILLEKRTDDGSWCYAGGSVEIDEMVEDAAKRELFEETGLKAKKLELFGIFSGPEMHFVYPNGDEVSNIDVVYICKDYEGSLKTDGDEVKKLQFFKKDEIPENIFKPNVMVLNKYISEIE